MSLPRFLDRVLDATVPALGALERDVLARRLEGTAVQLLAGERCIEGSSRSGFLLLANLAARLYPRIHLMGPEPLMSEAAAGITAINPRAVVHTGDSEVEAIETAAYEAACDAPGASVWARGWNVYLDSEPEEDTEPIAPSALAAAALGASELFRRVFAPELGRRGRREPQPGALSLVTLSEPTNAIPPLPNELELGELRLIGAGAIGQAAALTLAESPITASIAAIDHQAIDLSNLQRYLLTEDRDVGAVKVDLLRQRLGRPGFDIEPVPEQWSVHLVNRCQPTLVALDTPEDRIAVQAGLPGPIYNAWTQPEDIGWSRHERFGDEACLACLYWPTHERLARHDQIATALRQHPLRVLGYLLQSAVPVGHPLPVGAVPGMPGIPVPPEAESWTRVALLEDIATAAGVPARKLAAWRNRPLADLYQDGICGGALLGLGIGEAPREALVPLAHQSALAGIMLAAQVIIAAVPDLRPARPQAIEGRMDVLAGLPQALARPRQPTPGCLCRDSVFRDVYRDSARHRS